ncbi:hypothetical protein [Parabacteroides distasonis]|uniref:hypothetical protein n=1 Tax=Parabacteroides distasonis TaxID=823 RepID=UPI0021651677|nr:hypothetical protein [Parabacteroides distasonis]MCS2606227.1 hypothetical protein [Parabacteroides distasonis]
MMRRYTLYNQLMAVAAGLCLCWLCVACGEDRGGDLPDDDPNSCVVTITLRTSRSARPPQTKAGETITWEDDDKYERDITDWLVVAYDDENAELAGYTSSNGTWTPGINNPDSHMEVEMKLPLGKYSFYAFANLQSLELEDGTSLYQKIIRGYSLADLSEVKILDSGTSIDTRNEKEKGKFGGEEASRKLIPMSSYAQEYTLKPAPAENEFEIPLIRMIGKVQVKITNNLDKPITVKQLDIMNLRKGSLPIWLLPWGNNKYLETAGNDGAERLAPDLPTGEVVAEEHLFDEKIIPSEANKEDNIVPAKIKDGAEGHNIKTYTRYIPEGNAGAKEILLGVDIEGRPRTEHTTSFGFVRRNDLLIIPVLITNITTKLEVAEQRLPIGVYPTALVYGEKTGVQILTPVEHTLQAAGDLSIRFEISGIDGVTGDFSIKGYEEKEGGNVATEKYSSVSWKNADVNKPLITAINVDRTSFETDAELDIPEAALTPGTGQGGLKKAGSFTIRTQELGGEADATVVLTLVIKYGENMEQEMQIPYTIQIRNYEKQQQP